jgi:hypothetical protein
VASLKEKYEGSREGRFVLPQDDRPVQEFLADLNLSDAGSCLAVLQQDGVATVADLALYSEDDLRRLGVKGTHAKRIRNQLSQLPA